MSLGSTRVLRDRKPSRPLPEEYQGSSHQISHSLPQAYGADIYSVHDYPVSEASTGYNTPASSNWLPSEGSIGYDPGEYGNGGPQYIGNMALRSYGRGTPTTPAKSDISIADPRYGGNAHWTRSSSTPRNKPKRPKKEKRDTAKSMMPGDKPVPILSLDCEGPINEIELFVHRSTEARIKEVEGKNGYTPRPMNNFMLYRKAYQDKAKKVSSQTNHQVVSVIVAASWKNESKEIKDRFAKFAQIEKEHHIQAFPNYQFRPNKTNKGRKRKVGDFDDDASELDDPDWRRGTGPKRSRQDLHHTLPGNYTPEQQPQYVQVAHPYPQAGYAIDYAGQPIYYDQPNQWSQYDDVAWPVGAEFQDPLMNNHNTGALSGLPGGGNALLDPDFSNAIFDAPEPTLQPTPLLLSNDHSSGAFTQGEFEALDGISAGPNWQGTRPSIDGKTLPSAFQDVAADFSEDYFVNPA